MPNHIINELVFSGVDASKQDEIIARLCNDAGEVDFEILVPTPVNVWLGNVGSEHERAFRSEMCALDWSRIHWGTKWNAYSHKPVERTDNGIIFRFETAWRPPYTWLVAVFNTLKLPFSHNWLDEGSSRGVTGQWDYEALASSSFAKQPWSEEPCSDEMQRHLHKLHFGVEEFTDDAA